VSVQRKRHRWLSPLRALCLAMSPRPCSVRGCAEEAPSLVITSQGSVRGCVHLVVALVCRGGAIAGCLLSVLCAWLCRGVRYPSSRYAAMCCRTRAELCMPHRLDHRLTRPFTSHFTPLHCTSLHSTHYSTLRVILSDTGTRTHTLHCISLHSTTRRSLSLSPRILLGRKYECRCTEPIGLSSGLLWVPCRL
jgi:hypothetical protein